ncbi:MAG: SUMF1/EgtB/PvdO family nonheme iron enzyme [Spirochaetia bacterium]|jgi:hypothetical protein
MRSRGSATKRRLIAAAAPLVVLIALTAQSGSRGIVTVRSAGTIEKMQGNTGKRYALCIGINNFTDPVIPTLKGARNDAVELSGTLKQFGQFDRVDMLTDDIDPQNDPGGNYPKLANIRARLKTLSSLITPSDLVIFAFAGHGIANEAGDGYLVVADTRFDDKWNTSLPIKEVLDWLQKLKVRKSLLLLDACRQTMSQSASRGLDNTNLRAQKYEQSQVSAIFYGTKTGWSSYDDPNSNHGIFTRFLLEGMRGAADYQTGNSDGIVTFKELSAYVEQQVTSYAHELQVNQSPSITYNGESFGDLALSTYSATIDAATRSQLSPGAKEPAAAGVGAASVYSNVDGTVQLDGKPYGKIAKGQKLAIDELPAGTHNLQITHAYGVFNKEIQVKDGWRTNVVNMVINNERDNMQLGDVPFVFVKGSAGLPSFWMGMSEITFGQFSRFVRQTGYKAQGSWEKYYKPAYDWYPVIHVTWDDCSEYVKWFSKKFGVDAALPSLAQWQYAAGKKNGTVYPWSDDWDATYCQNVGSEAQDVLPLVGGNGPVQEQFFLKDMTLDGVQMMAGNVSEWCADQKKAADGVTDLAAAAGGSWRLSKPKYFASDYFSYKQVTAEEEDQGFRIVMKAD